ncbi:hypothetical protein SIL82_16150 [Sphingomonas echinoides]|uniref:Integral membrane protein n=1 Tax=Sphingomonas echinoides TaxID=59803 RepID=A0ABU4PPP6_9SPHN|nr:hypothetical protein [Sphingomonas echinoides]MDX5985787.1 hypothetical protein [Sphingomonas echinoides]
MSSATYLAWSALLAGLTAALVEIMRRRVRSTAADLTPLSVRTLIVLVIALFFGLVMTNLVAKAVLGVTPPAWSELISKLWLVVFGLVMIIEPTSASDRTAKRVIGIGFILIGLLIFLFELRIFPTKA